MSQASKSNIKNMNRTTHSTAAHTKKDNRSTPDFIRENRSRIETIKKSNQTLKEE